MPVLKLYFSYLTDIYRKKIVKQKNLLITILINLYTFGQSYFHLLFSMNSASRKRRVLKLFGRKLNLLKKTCCVTVQTEYFVLLLFAILI